MEVNLRKMKKTKILNSLMIIGLVLGSMNDAVVQAISSIESKTEKTSLVEKKQFSIEPNKEEDKINNKKIAIKDESNEQPIEKNKRTSARNNNPSDNFDSVQGNNGNYFKPTTDATLLKIGEEQAARVQSDLSKKSINISNLQHEKEDSFEVLNFSTCIFPNDKGLVMWPINGGRNSVYWTQVDSNSGIWRMRLYAAMDSKNEPYLNAKFTRLKYGSVSGNEVFAFPRVAYLSNPTGHINDMKPFLTKATFEVRLPTAEEEIGKIVATAKEGTHKLMQNAQPIPNPETYLDVKNTRGKVEYSWKIAPDTTKVGKQDTKILVKDESGREIEVVVPITVEPLAVEIKGKPGPFDIYQYDKLPDVTEYFEVTNLYGTYTLKWFDDVNTDSPGEQTWRAKVTTSDGREATSSIQMDVTPHEGLKVNLKSIEDRKLGYNYPTFATNFRDYIDSVTMHGEPVELRDLEFIPQESAEADYRIGGLQTLKLTVQTKHPNSGVMIKGTGEVTLNVLWDHSILMKSINGESAGSFTLRTDNSGNETAKVVFGMGIPTSINTAVGPQSTPFSLYYSFEVLRGETVIYSQEVTNRATWQQIMDKFGDSTGTIDVHYGDVIKIYHPERTPNSSVLMIDEQEQDYTYDTTYAYYKITPYGFDPFPLLEAEASQKSFVLGENTKTIDPASLIKNVTINGRLVDSSSYEVESLIDFDTSSIGTRKMKLKVTMNDGLSAEEFEVDYQVKWGSTFVLKGLNDATVGAFSLLKENDQWALHASQGVNGTDLSQPVNNHFGRDIYYGIEVIENITTKYQYNVLGNQSIKEGIEGFNQGKPLTVKQGDVIKVYHAEPTGNSLLMQDEIAKDFTMGSNDAYYEVTEHGLEPILAISTDTKPQEFSLGDDASGIDGTQLINQVTINGTELTPDLYTVKQLGNFDTTTVGQKELAIQFDTKDGVVSKVITVPYKVKWGRTIVMKSSTGGSAGVFSLQTTNTTRQLKIHQGFDSPLDERLGNDQDLYYSIEVLRGEKVQYSQEVPGRVTLQEVINSFGTNGTPAVTVQLDDVIKIYHPKNLLVARY
ncbi:wall-associated protein [Enterococcus mundtii]|nr:wall-associated protein [Enterococcus mundtii]